MAEWWSYLKGRPFYSVLDESDPAASYYMLRYVIERPDSARAVQAARLALQVSPEVAKLKDQLFQDNVPEWAADYSGSRWALRFLAEWGHPGDDESIATCLDHAIDTLENEGHPFAPLMVLHTALAFGFGEDERVRNLLNRLVRDYCFAESSHKSAEGLTLIAMALAAGVTSDLHPYALPGLKAQLCTLTPAALPDSSRYAYPTFDTPDGLTLAESALRLGIAGAWLEPWIEQVIGGQDEDGWWKAAVVHRSTADPRAPDRWISARAMYVLRAFFGE